MHLCIEKPLASSLEHCDAMLAAAEKGDAKIGMVCQRRFYEPVVRVKEAVESGKIGKPMFCLGDGLGDVPKRSTKRHITQ